MGGGRKIGIHWEKGNLEKEKLGKREIGVNENREIGQLESEILEKGTLGKKGYWEKD